MEALKVRLRTLGVLFTCIICITLFARADGNRIMARVSSVQDKTVCLDKGSADGVEPGMLFDIYREAKVVFIPMTKEKVFVEEKGVAQVIVTRVSARSSTCEAVRVSPDMEITAGDVAVKVNPKLAPNVNAPPTVESMEASLNEAYAGEEVTVTCKISDVNDNFHILKWSCDAGQLSAPETVVGKVRWLCPADRLDVTISVTVTDPYGAKATRTKRIKALGPGPRGKQFRPTATFGDKTPRFSKIACITFDSENRMLLLDANEKKLITLSDDFNVQRVSALYGEEFLFTSVKACGSSVYAVDGKSGSLIRYKYEGDIFRQKPEVIYGARGSGNGYFGKITGVEIASNGDVYVLDGSACAIHVFSQGGQFICSVGRRGDKPGELRLPTGMAMDIAGNLYVCDYARRKILKFGPGNEFLAEYDLGGKLGTPVSICYDRRSNMLFILERQPHAVKVLSTGGRLVREFKKISNSIGVLKDPEQLSVSRTGEVYIVCENGEVLKRYSAQGDFLGKMGGEKLSEISEFTVTPEGGLYLLNATTADIWHVDRNGWITSKFGGRGPNEGQLQTPAALCSDNNANLYVLDKSLRRILKFSRSGKFLQNIGNPGTAKDEIEKPIDLYGTGKRIFLLQYRSRWAISGYNPDGKLLIHFPDKEDETSRPSKIAVDKLGNSFIFTGHYEVEFFERDGGKRPGVRKSRLWLTDLAVDVRGDVFGTAPREGEIFRIDPAQQAAHWVITSTPAAKNCAGINFDKYGRMYLFDSNTKVIVRLSEVVR
jgi:hypothetical protein